LAIGRLSRDEEKSLKVLLAAFRAVHNLSVWHKQGPSRKLDNVEREGTLGDIVV